MTKRKTCRPPAGRGFARGALLALLLLLAAAPPARTPLQDDAPVSTEGTQFIRPPAAPPARPVPQPPPAPPAPPAPAPAPAAVQPPAPPPGPPPRFPSVVILLDVSDSMLAKSPGKSLTHLDEAKNALRAVISGMSPETRVQVWTFSTRMEQVTVKQGKPRAFTPVGDARQREQLLARIQEIRVDGGTNLYRSVIAALDLFADPRDQAAYRGGLRFPVLVIVSDGEDWGKTGHTLEQVQAAARKLPLVTVTAIGFTVGQGDPWFKTLCQLASRLSGCATADDQRQLQALLDSFYRPPDAAALKARP